MLLQRTELDRAAMALMVLLSLIFGLQQVSIKVANEGISPLWQASLRWAGATVLVAGWAAWRGVSVWRADGTLRPGLLAGLLFAAEFALIFVGLEYTTASRGILFLYTTPFFVALGARWLLPHETLRAAQWFGMALAFAGVVLLFGEHFVGSADNAWLGDLMMLAAAVLWGATTLTIKASRLVAVPAAKTLLYQLGVSAAVFPVIAAMSGEPGIFAATPLVWASLGFQIVIVSTASYLTWFWLITQYPATRLSSFSFLTPVLGVLAGGLLLNEPLTPGVWGALALVGSGIFIANRPARR